jgi:hypothetical protein
VFKARIAQTAVPWIAGKGPNAIVYWGITGWLRVDAIAEAVIAVLGMSAPAS